jgi:hypothetical protein
MPAPDLGDVQPAVWPAVLGGCAEFDQFAVLEPIDDHRRAARRDERMAITSFVPSCRDRRCAA